MRLIFVNENLRRWDNNRHINHGKRRAWIQERTLREIGDAYRNHVVSGNPSRMITRLERTSNTALYMWCAHLWYSSEHLILIVAEGFLMHIGRNSRGKSQDTLQLQYFISLSYILANRIVTIMLLWQLFWVFRTYQGDPHVWLFCYSTEYLLLQRIFCYSITWD